MNFWKEFSSWLWGTENQTKTYEFQNQNKELGLIEFGEIEVIDVPHMSKTQGQSTQ